MAPHHDASLDILKGSLGLGDSLSPASVAAGDAVCDFTPESVTDLTVMVTIAVTILHIVQV